MSVCVVDNNMTTSASSTELNDTNCVSPPSIKAGIPAIPKRPTIIRVDKQNVQENTDESKSREVPKVPPRPPPPRPGPPPVPSKQPVLPKSSEGDKKKKKLEITIVSARPMSEVCFRDKKPEIPVPPRPQKPKDQGELSSAPSLNCINVSLSKEPSKQTQHSTTDVGSKSPTVPPERPRLPPAAVTKKDPPKVPPQRPAPLKSTLSAPIESSPPPRPPACIQLKHSQPHSDLTDGSPDLPKEQSTQLTPPKPRPRTFIDTSSKPQVAQRSVSAYKPTKNKIPPRPLPRKHGSSSSVNSDASKTSTVEPIAEVIPPPKPSRHQSFRDSASPIQPNTRPCSSPPSQLQETSSESVSSTPSSLSAEVSTTDEVVLDTIPPATEKATPATEEAKPVIEEATSAIEEATPATEEATPAIEKATPATEEATPATEEATPATEEATTATEKATPATEEATSATEEATSAIEEAIPAIEEATPAIEEATPATEETTPATEEATPAIKEATPTDKTTPPSSESTETPESFKVENESSSTDKPTPCPLPPKKNSVVISQSSFKCFPKDDAPVPSPRVKRSPKLDTPVSTPVNSNPAPILSEEPKDFILPSAEDILTSPTATVNKPTIIRASTSIESLKEQKSTSVSKTLSLESAEKPPKLSASSEKLPLEETTKNVHRKDPEDKIKYRAPPPIPKKNPISANVCDRDVPNGNSAKTFTRPAIPKKPPKPCPPAVAQMPVKNKQNLLKEPEAKVDGGSSGGGNLMKKLIFPKKSSSLSSSSTDLKKSSSVKSRKASEMLQTTKDYTRRITKSLGFSAAEEPTTVWYTDEAEEPEEKNNSLDKKKETPSIWYVDADFEEETDPEKDPVPPTPALQTDKSKKPEKDQVEKKKEMDNNLCERKEEPSPTEISAFQKYHSYMKRTIEEAVGHIHLTKSTSSLIDTDLNEVKEEQGSDVMKPQPVKPTVPDPPKQRPPIPSKESHPPKPSAPPQVKPNVPAVPPKRPPVPVSIIQPSTKPEVPAVRPPPLRPKPMVSVKPTVPNNQNIISDNDLNSKNVITSEKRTSSIENLIGKFEEELCKKSVPPPRPAQPVNKPKTVTSNLTDNQEQQLSSENKETVQSADTKTDITSMPSNTSDGSKSSIQPDENENLSVSANTGGTENSQTSNQTADSSIDENANEGAEDEPEKPQDANTVANVNVELSTEETSVTAAEQSLSHKVVHTDSFNQRCKSLMNDLKIRFENEEKDGTDNEIEEVVKSVGQSLDQLDVNPEKMLDSSSNGETEEKELEEKVEPPSSEEKSSSHLSLQPDTTEVTEKTSQDHSTSQIESRVESDTKVIELDSKDAGHKEPQKSSSTSEFTGPKAIANFDFDAQAEDELTLKKDDKVQLLSWVDTSWLYGTCHGKTGIFPSVFVHIIEPLPQTPSDTNGNLEITDVSLESAMEEDAKRVPNHVNSTQVMDDAYQKLSGSIKETTEATGISTKEEVSEGVAEDDDEVDGLTDSEQLDKINIPVGGEDTIAYALYDFDGEDGELNFKEGDAITILKWINEDWLLGKKDEMVGNLPANFVNFTGDSAGESDLVDTDGPPEPKEPPPPLQADVLEHVKRLKGFACARFDFEARDDDELSFKDGDRIEIVEFVNNDWIRGSLHKKEGIFPAAFVSVEEFSPDEEFCTSETTKVRALHEFTASAHDELSFKAGALITCHGEVPNLPGWSNGSFEGRTGMFPTEFVTQEGF